MTSLPRFLALWMALAATAIGGAFLSGCDRTMQADARATDPALSLPVVETALVASHALNTTTSLPGELQPYETVAIYPKVTAFVDWIGVDRGSRVRKGELLARLVAPELSSQKLAAQAQLESAESRRIEAQAKTAADEATYERLKAASATPGVISDNELEIAMQTATGDRARQQALRQTVEAARATLKSVEDTTAYLRIAAPFDGVVTDRNVHPGALVGPGGSRSQTAMLDISQISRLRLVVAVPETSVAYISPGAQVSFTVAAFPNETFHGTVARLARTLDEKTRTMPVELDVDNSDGRLSPGMYPQVIWPERRSQATLFVPASAVAHSMQDTFVIRIRNGVTEWVHIKTGVSSGDETEVYGNLAAGDQIALRGTEELRPGVRVTAKPSRASAQP